MLEKEDLPFSIRAARGMVTLGCGRRGRGGDCAFKKDGGANAGRTAGGHGQNRRRPLRLELERRTLSRPLWSRNTVRVIRERRHIR